MKITVLGPWGAYPKAGEATAGYLLEHGGFKYLIDCGSGVLSQLQKNVPLYDLNAVLISHDHYDHVADLGCLQYAALVDTDLGKRKEELPIYLAGGMSRHTFRSMKGSVVYPIVEESVVHLNGGIKVTFFETFHEYCTLAMRFELDGKSIVYTADTFYDERLTPICKDADLLIAETSFYAEFEAKKYGHMNTLDVGKLATEASVKRLVLTHLPHFGNIEKLVEEVSGIYKEEVILAKMGLSLEV